MKNGKRILATALIACGMGGLGLNGVTAAQPALPTAPALPAGFEIPQELDVTSMVNESSVTKQPNADKIENYVSFGDSMAANPSSLDVVMDKAIANGANVDWPTISGDKCAQDPNNFARQVALKTGLKLNDYSCAGLTAYTKTSSLVPGKRADVGVQVDKALSQGALNRDTQLVTMLIGFNEFYQQGHWDMTPDQRDAAYRTSMNENLRKIKAAAPNAQIQLLGYPDETDGNNNTCGSNILGVQTVWYFPFIAYFQDELYDQQRTAAQENGVHYIPFKDEINVRNGNSGCLKDGPRYNSTFFDDSSHRFAIHLTDNGHRYYGERIVQDFQARP